MNFKNFQLSSNLQKITQKVLSGKRISAEEGLALYQEGELGYLGMLANHIREKKHGNYTYFNRNLHIEPTNKCVFTCTFCSYSRLIQEEKDAWELSAEEILEKVKAYKDKPITEVHIVGGVHPKLRLDFFCRLLKQIKATHPDLHIKAFTAVELEYMFRKDKVSIEEGINRLKEAGLDSLPGGGAEIFHDDIRNKICKDKATPAQWLEIHETAHKIGMPSNATILYGHMESYRQRIYHMDILRRSQDKTGGYNAFIPLKYRSGNNELSHLGEVSVIEDMKNYAVSRIFMDNFEHIKAYWPMIGRSSAQLSLAFGVDDIDGTIDDSTKIYSMAGAEEQAPAMTTQQIVQLIKEVRRHPVERDTLYNIIKDYKDVKLTELTEA